MAKASRFAAVVASGLFAAAAVLATTSSAVTLRPGGAAWSRFVLGSASGAFAGGLLVRVPAFTRREGDSLVIEAGPRKAADLTVSIDRGPLQKLHIPPTQQAILPLPWRSAPGLRVNLRPVAGAGRAKVSELTVRPGRAPPLWLPVLSALLAGAIAAGLVRRWSAALATSVGPLAAALLGLAATPAHLALSLPALPALQHLAVPLFTLVLALLAALRLHQDERWVFGRLAVVVTVLVFGAWIRVSFLPSPGSWDMGYWRARMQRAVAAGIPYVYGDPAAVPAGHALAQLRGEEPLWSISAHGRAFNVDYPPLAMALWKASWWVVTQAAPDLDPDAAQNCAAKLPAVLGDVVGMLVLLWAFRRRPWRGLALACLYWAVPVSWLSSALLGYLDGAYAPLAALSLVFAARGRSAGAGAWLALACLVKPTAIVMAPAVVVALASRSAILRATAAGLSVVAVVLVPFARAGTLVTAFVHVYSILNQNTLSGGYANIWWIVGHFMRFTQPGWSSLGAVQYARLDELAFNPAPLGTALFAVAALMICRWQRNAKGLGPVALSGATLLLAYGALAIGVHDNHPHPFSILILLTGLATARIRWLALVATTSLALNSACLSGLGRLGVRREFLEPLSRWVAGWRMALGFDLTLALAVVNIGVLAVLFASLRAEMQRLSELEARP